MILQKGNFIDTANNYQDEQSETWIGEWLQKNGKRDEFVIATKYSSPYTKYKVKFIQFLFSFYSVFIFLKF